MLVASRKRGGLDLTLRQEFSLAIAAEYRSSGLTSPFDATIPTTIFTAPTPVELSEMQNDRVNAENFQASTVSVADKFG